MDFFSSLSLAKLAVAAFLGLIIGLERELKRKPVGLKTSLVISIVSCLLTIVSIESAYSFPSSDDVNITMDPLRLAAQIVSGIGFIGAGVILHRGNDTISGLTTAAIIWGAAGIGIAVGAGFFIEALVGVVFIIVSVELLPFLLALVGPVKLREKEMSVKLLLDHSVDVNDMVHHINLQQLRIEKIRIKDIDAETVQLDLVIGAHREKRVAEVYQMLSMLAGVQKVDIELV